MNAPKTKVEGTQSATNTLYQSFLGEATVMNSSGNYLSFRTFSFRFSSVPTVDPARPLANTEIPSIFQTSEEQNRHFHKHVYPVVDTFPKQACANSVFS